MKENIKQKGEKDIKKTFWGIWGAGEETSGYIYHTNFLGLRVFFPHTVINIQLAYLEMDVFERKLSVILCLPSSIF